MKEKVSKKFQEIYGSGAILFASPGRINLIGEHTDYNGGFVFPGAVGGHQTQRHGQGAGLCARLG